MGGISEAFSASARKKYDEATMAARAMYDAIERGKIKDAERYLYKGASLKHDTSNEKSPVFRAFHLDEPELLSKIVQRMTAEDVASYNNFYYILLLRSKVKQFFELAERLPPSKEEKIEIATKLLTSSQNNYVFRCLAKAAIFQDFEKSDWTR